MGVHAGVVFFTGGPVDRARRSIATWLDAVAPEGARVFTDSIAVVGFGACHTWSGDDTARQPAVSRSGLVATWDGRLDNRADLHSHLGGAMTRDVDHSDAALALAVFERFGVDGLRLLIGDWSLVVWDRRRRTVFLARDYMGVRPLYYSHRGGGFVAWSSGLGELAVRAGCAETLDERFVAAYMAIRHSGALTPYTDVEAVPPAHCVCASADRTEHRRFWTLDARSIEHADARVYEERLRDLWREAVAARLRTDRPVWAELSGGLDSSSVVCAADALIKTRAVPAPRVCPVSHIAVNSAEGDERRFIEAVERQIGERSTVFALEDHENASDLDMEWVTPLAARGVAAAIIDHVRASGGRVILSGRAGDAVMGCIGDNSLAVFDDVAAGRWRTALAEIRRWSRATRTPFIEIAWRLAVECLPSAFSPTLAAPLNDTQQRGADLLTVRLNALLDAIPTAADIAAASAPRRSKRQLAMLLLGYSVEGRLGIPALPPDLSYTYPFLHRPLVEFVMAIPGRELSAPGVMRNLMRRAFKGLLPELILARTSKGYYPPAVMRALRPLAAAARPVDRLEVVQRGWIDAARLDGAIRMLVDGGGTTGAEVHRVLRLERWLRNRQGPRRTPTREEVKCHDVLNA